MRNERIQIPVQSHDWVERAACRGITTEVRNRIFFPEKGYSSSEAKAICLGTKRTRNRPSKPPCPVMEQCRAYALSLPFGETVGIWAGLTQNERRTALYDMELVSAGIIHGTNSGYEKERRWKMRICDDCREARRIHLKNKRVDTQAESMQ